jgi:hypothetical protein
VFSFFKILTRINKNNKRNKQFTSRDKKQKTKKIGKNKQRRENNLILNVQQFIRG